VVDSSRISISRISTTAKFDRSSKCRPAIPAPCIGDICQWALNEDAKLSGDGLTKLDGSMWNPLELAIDPSNNVYISGQHNVVQRISAVTGTLAMLRQRYDSIQGGYSGDKGPAIDAKMANLEHGLTRAAACTSLTAQQSRPLCSAGARSYLHSDHTGSCQWALGATGSRRRDVEQYWSEDLSLTGSPSRVRTAAISRRPRPADKLSGDSLSG